MGKTEQSQSAYETVYCRAGRADSHVDSHGGGTPSDAVEAMDKCHARYGREDAPEDPVNGFHGDF